MITTRLAALLSTCALVTACAGAPAVRTDPAPPVDALLEQFEELDDPLPWASNVRKGVLDNGLTWYVEPNAEPQARAEFRLVVRAGSLHSASTPRRSRRSGASSSRSGGAAEAPGGARATPSSRSRTSAPDTPTGCRSAPRSPCSASTPPPPCASTGAGTART